MNRKGKNRRAWLNLATVVLVALAFIGVRMCVHYGADSGAVGAVETDTTRVAADTVAAQKPAKEKRQKKEKPRKTVAKPIERSFLDEDVPTE